MRCIVSRLSTRGAFKRYHLFIAEIGAGSKLLKEKLENQGASKFISKMEMITGTGSKIAGGFGIAIILMSTIYEEILMWKDGASVQDMEVKALSGAFDLLATYIGFLGPSGLAASLIYYGVEMGMIDEGIAQNPLIYPYEHDIKGGLEYVEDLL